MCIHGVGGIGKTSLLTEIYKRYAGNQKKSLRLTNILDFDNRVLHLPENIERQIAQQLDETTFEPYLRGLLDWRKMEKAGVSPEGLEKQSQRVREIFIEKFNHFSQDHRIALLLDTTEKLEDQAIWGRLITFMGAAQNTIFLLAARNAKKLWTRLRESEIGHDALLIDLPAFTEQVGQQYLEQKESLQHITLDTALKQKLLLLSGGRPILLELAVEWLTRELPRDWMSQKSYEELLSLSDEQLTEYKADFEVQLVQHITQLRDSIDRLTLVMSWIYPLSPTMIAKLLNFSQERAQMLFDDAQTYVFIKSLPDQRITLHDEMRRMIEQYVWHYVYPLERRRRDSRIATELFQEENQRLKKRLALETADLAHLFERAALARDREIVHQQWIEHALYAAPESGFDVWKKLVEQRRLEKRFSFANSLIQLASAYYEQLTPEQQFEFELLKARLTNDTGQVRQAKTMLQQLLEKNLGWKARESNIYNALGVVESKLGKLWEARDYQLKCLEIVREIEPESIAPVANQVGYIHRLLGQPKEAQTYYKLALHSSNKRHKILIAGILSNLAYASGAQRKYSEMEIYCRQAIQIWSEIGADRSIGRAEETMAVFSRVRGRYEQAIMLLQRAISRYKEPDDHYYLCRSLFELGWTQFYQSERINEEAADIRLVEWDEALLEQARHSLDRSRDLAERYGLEALLPSILHVNGLVYWYLGRMCNNSSLLNRARQLNTVSYETGKEVGDIQYSIASLVAVASWDYQIEKYDQIEHYAQELGKYKQAGYYYPFYFGRMCRIEADIAFAQQEYPRAFSKYAEGLAMIHEHGGYSRFTIDRELLRLENKMSQTLSLALFEQWAGYLLLQWTTSDGQELDLLKSWAEQQIFRANLIKR